MKKNEVRVGAHYWTKLGNCQTAVEVIREEMENDKVKYRVAHYDTKKELPKLRSAAQLHEIKPED